MTDIEREESACRELRTLLDLYPNAAPGLEERIKAGKINPSDYYSNGCGCIYGSLVMESRLPPRKGGVVSRALDLRRSLYGSELSPLEEFVCDLPTPDSFDPPFYPLDNPVALKLLRWVQQWRQEHSR